MSNTEEIWKPVVGWEGWYEVSNKGRVRSLSRIDSQNRRLQSRILKPQNNSDNRLHVMITKSATERKLFKVHRLVALTFISNPNNFPEVNHLDGNPQNNDVTNLEWTTASENIKHAYRLGLRKPRDSRGEKSNFVKLTEKQVIEIREKFTGDFKEYAMLSEEYKITSRNVRYIVNRKTWTHI